MTAADSNDTAVAESRRGRAPPPGHDRRRHARCWNLASTVVPVTTDPMATTSGEGRSSGTRW